MSLRSKIIAHTHGNMAFWGIIFAVAAVVLFYGYSVNRTIMLVSQRNTVETKIATLRAQVTDLESSYIDKSSAITSDLATTLGYKESDNVVYVPERSVSVAVRTSTVQ